MALIDNMEQTGSFMKSLGFPDLRIHQSINHFDFTKTNRKILIIGPMGSGKTEFSARIYRDSQVAMGKSEKIRELTTSQKVDRRSVFNIRPRIDDKRFENYPTQIHCLSWGAMWIQGIIWPASKIPLSSIRCSRAT